MADSITRPRVARSARAAATVGREVPICWATCVTVAWPPSRRTTAERAMFSARSTSPALAFSDAMGSPASLLDPSIQRYALSLYFAASKAGLRPGVKSTHAHDHKSSRLGHIHPPGRTVCSASPPIDADSPLRRSDWYWHRCSVRDRVLCAREFVPCLQHSTDS